MLGCLEDPVLHERDRSDLPWIYQLGGMGVSGRGFDSITAK
jgi:hypothetical protein